MSAAPSRAPRGAAGAGGSGGGDAAGTPAAGTPRAGGSSQQTDSLDGLEEGSTAQPAEPKPKRVRPKQVALGSVIVQLSDLLTTKQRQVDALVTTQRGLRARAAVAQIALQNAEALLLFGATLAERRRGGEGGGGGGDGGGEGGEAPGEGGGGFGEGGEAPGEGCRPGEGGGGGGCGCACSPHAIGELKALRQQLEAERAASAAAAGPHVAFEINWTPQGAAAAAAEASDEGTSSEGVRKYIRAYVQATSPLIARVREAAPDAAFCQARLAQLRQGLVERMAVVLMARHAFSPSPADVWLRPLDADAGAAPGGSAGEGAPARGGAGPPLAPPPPAPPPPAPPPPPPPLQHWVWAVRTGLRLDPAQELLVSALLAFWRERSAAADARRAAVAALAARTDARDAGAQRRVVAALEGAQEAFITNYVVCSLSFYGAILRPEQAAAWMGAAYPFVPSLAALDSALQEIRIQDGAQQPLPQAQAAQQAQPQQQPAPLPPAAPRPQAPPALKLQQKTARKQ